MDAGVSSLQTFASDSAGLVPPIGADGDPTDGVPDVPEGVQVLMDACRDEIADLIKVVQPIGSDQSPIRSIYLMAPNAKVTFTRSISTKPLKKEKKAGTQAPK